MTPIDPKTKDPQTHAVIGAAMEVHRELGNGFLEAVYQEALALEFTQSNIPFQKEVQLPVIYKGEPLKCSYRADFICFGDIIVELKSLSNVGNNEQSQMINYLKASGKKRGLLLNFGSSSLEFRRFVI